MTSTISSYERERLFNGDVRELRSKYLFDFAKILHINPLQIDALRLTDFFQLILDIDAYRAEIKRQNDAYQAG